MVNLADFGVYNSKTTLTAGFNSGKTYIDTTFKYNSSYDRALLRLKLTGPYNLNENEKGYLELQLAFEFNNMDPSKDYTLNTVDMSIEIPERNAALLPSPEYFIKGYYPSQTSSDYWLGNWEKM